VAYNTRTEFPEGEKITNPMSLTSSQKMESLHPFRISIKTGPDPQYGYLVNPDRNLHILMTEISRRAIAIMRTNRAKGALRLLADRWSEEHKKSLFPDAAVSGFQCLLASADMDAIKWPLVVMDFTMEGTRSAQFVYPTVSIMDSNAPYPVQRDSIHLDGVVSCNLVQFDSSITFYNEAKQR
jgi:hypothetical protein